MGHFLSRAFRRLTQCSNQSTTRNQQQQQNAAQKDKDTASDVSGGAERPKVESIPVGQSIDSAEYRALEPNTRLSATTTTTISTTSSLDKKPEVSDSKVEVDKQIVEVQPAGSENEGEDNENRQSDTNSNNKQQGVEEAVIKIQALVRGHLTRKALKDANQLNQILPTSLGQRQFDEESLTKNPPSAVFLPTSPLSIQQQTVTAATPTTAKASSEQQQARTPLESIAEVIETTTAAATTTTTTTPSNAQTNDEQQRALRLEIPSGIEKGQMAPPLLSEAAASIDLGGESEPPASASILISDHNLRPAADKNLASVLHLRQQPENEQANAATYPQKAVNCEVSEPESETKEALAAPTEEGAVAEEAAAIRIQSAFRGYRTRKNSPYRTRSPNQSATAIGSNGVAPVEDQASKQQAHIIQDENHKSEQEHDSGSDEAAPPASGTRRMSRLRRGDSLLDEVQVVTSEETSEQRRLAPTIQGAVSIDEFTTTDDTVKEAALTPSVRTQQAKAESPELIESADGERDHQVDTLSGAAQQQAIDHSLANTIDALEAPSLSGTNISAALETATTSEAGQKRPSLGKSTDVSLELDTDSSFLGAALSLDDTEAGQAALSAAPTESLARAERILSADGSEFLNNTTLGDLSVRSDNEFAGVVGSALMSSDELELEGRKLVLELERAGEGRVQVNEDESALEEAASRLEAALEEALNEEQPQEESELNEEEQRAIELESDDIERRDPRGHAAEERAKSPQIRMEAPDFGGHEKEAEIQPTAEIVDEPQGEEIGDNQRDEEELMNTRLLEVGGPTFGTGDSGRSSPALYSSNANSSGSSNSAGEESEEDQRNGESRVSDKRQQQQQQQQQQQTQRQSGTGSRNKKRNNRNKRKGKK